MNPDLINYLREQKQDQTRVHTSGYIRPEGTSGPLPEIKPAKELKEVLADVLFELKVLPNQIKKIKIKHNGEELEVDLIEQASIKPIVKKEVKKDDKKVIQNENTKDEHDLLVDPVAYDESLIRGG